MSPDPAAGGPGVPDAAGGPRHHKAGQLALAERPPAETAPRRDAAVRRPPRRVADRAGRSVPLRKRLQRLRVPGRTRTSGEDYLPLLALAGGLVLGVAVGVASVPGAALVCLILMTAAALIWPQHLTIALLAMIYSNTPAVLVRNHGVPAVVALAVTLALAYPLGHRVIIKKEPLVLPRILPLVLLFGAIQAASAVGAPDVHAATLEVASFLLEGALLFVLVSGTVCSITVLRRAIWAVVLTGGALGLLSVIQQLTGTFSHDYFGFAEVSQAILPTAGTSSRLATVTNAAGQTGVPRLAGPIGEKNRYAQILVILVPMALSLVVLERRRIAKLIAWGAAVCCIAGIVLTYSRGAVVALAVGLIVAFLLKLIPARLMAVMAVVMALAVLVVPAFRERVLSLQGVLTGGSGVNGQAKDNAIRGRATENLAALLAVADHPLLGVGPGAFPSVYMHYAGLVGGHEHLQERESHDLYLGVAAELGLLGLGTLLAMLGSLGLGLWRARAFDANAPPDPRQVAGPDTGSVVGQAARTEERSRFVLAVLCSGLFASLVTYLVTGVFLHLSYQRYFWFFLALCAAACTLAETQQRAETRSAPHEIPV